jgi:23S rRNA (uracil1939-C5)-methyltransferase
MIFVPFTLPGERVRVEIVDGHKRWARAGLLELIEASPQRVDPKCLHFADCGGCHYQHMSYADQLTAKTAILQEQFERIAGIQVEDIRAPVPAPAPFRTRNHLQFSLDSGCRLGFKAMGSNRVVPIQECYLPLAGIDELWPRIQLESCDDLSRLGLRAGTSGDPMIVFHAQAEPGLEIVSDWPASIVWMEADGLTVLAGEGDLHYQVREHTFRVSAPTFFQVNTPLLEALVDRVLGAIQPEPGQTVLDLYAGAGLFSAFIAQAGAKVIAVEESPWACSDFEANLYGFNEVELYEASVEIALPAVPTRADCVLVDPPRAGLSKQAIHALLALTPARIVYLSCDPATLARDARRLTEAGYQLTSVTPIDMFPQTYHIETLTTWAHTQ